jgi:hypothetical protein
MQKANLYLFMGETGKAIDTSPHRETKEKLRKRLNPKPNVVYEKVDGIEHEFLGYRQSLQLSGAENTVNIFQGLSTAVINLLDSTDFGRAAIVGQNIFDEATKVSSKLYKSQLIHHRNAVIFNEDNTMVGVIGRDGTMLKIEI